MTISSLANNLSNKFLVPLLVLILPLPMDKIKIASLEKQELQPLVWFRHTDNIFLIW